MGNYDRYPEDSEYGKYCLMDFGRYEVTYYAREVDEWEDRYAGTRKFSGPFAWKRRNATIVPAYVYDRKTGEYIVPEDYFQQSRRQRRTSHEDPCRSRFYDTSYSTPPCSSLPPPEPTYEEERWSTQYDTSYYAPPCNYWPPPEPDYEEDRRRARSVEINEAWKRTPQPAWTPPTPLPEKTLLPYVSPPPGLPPLPPNSVLSCWEKAAQTLELMMSTCKELVRAEAAAKRKRVVRSPPLPPLLEPTEEPQSAPPPAEDALESQEMPPVPAPRTKKPPAPQLPPVPAPRTKPPPPLPTTLVPATTVKLLKPSQPPPEPAPRQRGEQAAPRGPETTAIEVMLPPPEEPHIVVCDSCGIIVVQQERCVIQTTCDAEDEEADDSGIEVATSDEDDLPEGARRKVRVDSCSRRTPAASSRRVWKPPDRRPRKRRKFRGGSLVRPPEEDPDKQDDIQDAHHPQTTPAPAPGIRTTPLG